MPKQTASIKTLGCKLNQYESEQMRVQLERLGYQMVDYVDGADVCIINSCTVTSRTDRECRRLARRAKRMNPDAMVVVAGCYVEVRPEDIQAIEAVDLLLKHVDKHHIADFVPPAECSDTCRVAAANDEGPIIPDFSHHTRAFLKVQEGCNARCAYCIIPDARGPARSVPISHVLAQCKAFAQHGCPEIVLIGTHLGQYGKDLDEDIDLAALVKSICEFPIPRLRLSSIEPCEITPALERMVIEGGRALAPGLVAAVQGKMCRHLHVPLQSGCDTVLNRMGRPYDTAFYGEMVTRIMKTQPMTGIGADVIVGFPGETDEEFEMTRAFVESLPLSYLHVFTFSEREGTRAAEMPNPVPYEVRKARNHVLRDISEQKRIAFALRMVDRDLEVVLQQPDQNGGLWGVSDNYIEIDVENAQGRSGELVTVNIVGSNGPKLQGRIVE